MTVFKVAISKDAIFFFLLGLLIFSGSCRMGNDQEKGEVEVLKTSVLESLELTSKDSVKAKYLVSVSSIKNQLDAGEPLLIFELSKGNHFTKEGHLPGALPLWRPDYGSTQGYDFGGMRASKKEMEALLSSKGATPDTWIALYDVKGSCDAVRLAWILDLYGHKKIKIINGGKVAWKAQGFPLVHISSPLPKPTAYQFVSPTNNSRLATIEDVKLAIDDPEILIVDTREPEEYAGRAYINKGKLYRWKKGAYSNGCIPSAIHLNWSESVDLDGDHRFKSIKDLRYNFEKAGITPDKKIITYCHSGVRSSNTTYVLTEILGYPNVKNYDGSWIEWSYHYQKDKSVAIQRHTKEEEYQREYLALENQLKEEGMME